MAYRLGVDLGGTTIKAGVVDEKKRMVCHVSLPTGADRPFETVVADMAAAAKQAAAQAGLDMGDFPCVGFGMPGLIDLARGIHVFAGNLGWHNVPITAELQRHFSIPVFVGNDANCAVVGETVAGAASGLSNVLMFTLGTGVGGGIIVNGKLFTGGNGMGAELGHVQLCFDGAPCSCGINGCLEAYASVTALIRQTEEAMARHSASAMHAFAQEQGGVDGRTAFECAKAGDEAAAAVVDTYLNYLAAGLGSLINVFRPEVVLIGGGLSNQREHLLVPLAARARRYTFASDLLGMPPIRRAALGNDAGIYGAAYLSDM